MMADFLQDRVALYVSGALPAGERDAFEVIVESRPDLRAQVAELQEAMVAVALADVPAVAAPPPALRSRLLAAVEAQPVRPEPEALVVADAAGLVEWVNPAFTALCGYTPDELRGRKPGHLLQGPDTDRAAIERIRAALRAPRACRETLVNYHKDGTRYRVDVRIAPILDDDGRPAWFVARERRVPDPVGAPP